MTRPAQPVDDQIAGRAEQIGSERQPGIEVPATGPDAQEDLVNHLFRVGMTRQRGLYEIADFTAITVKQQLESRLIPLVQVTNQRLFIGSVLHLEKGSN